MSGGGDQFEFDKDAPSMGGGFNEATTAIGNASSRKPASRKPVKEKQKPHYHGHRDRLRERFETAGEDAVSDYELLELLLYRFIPRRDTKPIAKDLLARFGSLSDVLNASHSALCSVSGIGSSAAMDIQITAALTRRSLREELREKTVLSSWSAVVKYCHTAMAYENVEQFRILFLDKRNCLIADEVQQRGTLDHTPVYPREVVKRALELSASALVLVHNHPSGDPTPSVADIEMTQTIIQTASPMGITIHDHLIIGRDGHISMKSEQLI